MLFPSLNLFAQNILTGTVVDEDDLPLPNVNVFVENTQKGTLQILMVTIVLKLI